MSVKNWHTGPKTCKNIKIAGPASQLHVSPVGTTVILTNYCQSIRTCKCFICQFTTSTASLWPRTCKFQGHCYRDSGTEVSAVHITQLHKIFVRFYQDVQRRHRRWHEWMGHVEISMSWGKRYQGFFYRAKYSPINHNTLLTYWGHHKYDSQSQMTLGNTFYWQKMWQYWKIIFFNIFNESETHLKLTHCSPMDLCEHWFSR